MDGEAFDDLVKRLTVARLTRLAALRGVVASAAVGLAGAAFAAETDAKKKKRGKVNGKQAKASGKQKRKGKQGHGKGERKTARGTQDKVTLCHKPGTPEEATITVAPSAVKAHQKHGDTLGACGATTTTTAVPTTTTTAAPPTTTTTEAPPTTTTEAPTTTTTAGPDPFLCTGSALACGDPYRLCGVNNLCQCVKTAADEDLCTSVIECRAGDCSQGDFFNACVGPASTCIKGVANCTDTFPCASGWGCAIPFCNDTF